MKAQTSEATNPQVKEIQTLWAQIEESRRVDPVAPQFEMSFFFQTAMRDARLRLAALKSRIDAPERFDADIQEITKELELCTLIAELMFSLKLTRRT